MRRGRRARSLAGIGQGELGVHRSDRGCSFAHRRGHALHRTEPDVARGEHTWNRGLEGQGPAAQRVPARSEVMVELGIGANEACFIGGDNLRLSSVSSQNTEAQKSPAYSIEISSSI